ncbi:MAG TPA: hypothetical protein VGM88_01990 [Kofleriaceae bacterium]|jgi:hypothetical protein
MYRVLALAIGLAACEGGHMAPDARLGGTVNLHVTSTQAFDALVVLQASDEGLTALGPLTPQMQASGEAAEDVAYRSLLVEDDVPVSPAGTEASVSLQNPTATLVIALRENVPVGVAEVTDFTVALATTQEVVLEAVPAVATVEVWGAGGHCAKLTSAGHTSVWVPDRDPDCDGIDSAEDCQLLVYCDRAHPTDLGCVLNSCEVNCPIGGDACNNGTALVCHDDGPTPFIQACAAPTACPLAFCLPRAACSGTGAVLCQYPRAADGTLCNAPATAVIAIPETACSAPRISNLSDQTAGYAVAFEDGTCNLDVQIASIAGGLGPARLDYNIAGALEGMDVDLEPFDDPACATAPSCTAVTAEATCDYR